ncbi:MAG: caspase family protein [Bacteroidota bacterium]
MKEDYAIVVGINHYPGMNPLKGAEQDALNFIEWLKDPKGGDVPKEQIFTVLSSDFEPQPDSPNYARPKIGDIHAKFDDLSDIYIDSTEDPRKIGRRLYLFFSGHGIGKYQEGALLMSNAKEPGRLPHFPSSDAAEEITKSAAFEEVILFMDCCRDDYSKDFVKLNYIFLQQPKLAEDIKYFRIFASKLGQKAREAPNPQANNRYEGYFTRALMISLREGVQDNNEINSETLLAALEKNLKNLVPDEAAFNNFSHRMEPPNQKIFFGEKSVADKELFAILQIPLDKFTTINVVEIKASNNPIPIKTISTQTDDFTLNADENVMEISFPLNTGYYKVLLPETNESDLFEVINTKTRNYVRIG